MKGAAAAINTSTASRICKQFSGRCFIAEFKRKQNQLFCYSFIIIENSSDAAGAVRINNKICTFAVGFDTFGIKFEHGFASAADQGTVGGFCVQQYVYIPVQKNNDSAAFDYWDVSLNSQYSASGCNNMSAAFRNAEQSFAFNLAEEGLAVRIKDFINRHALFIDDKFIGVGNGFFNCPCKASRRA